MEVPQTNVELSESDIRSLLQRQQDSGKSKVAFAKEHGIAIHKLHYWRRKLNRSSKRAKVKLDQGGFAPVKIVSAPVKEKALRAEICFPDGTRVFLNGEGIVSSVRDLLSKGHTP